MATSADITLDVSDFPSEIPCGKTHMSYVDKILAYRHGVLLVPGRDYVLEFEFTKDGVVVPEIDWCETSDSITIKVVVGVKPEFGPSNVGLLATPSDGPATIISELEQPPSFGPTTLTSELGLPSFGPTTLTPELELPYSGPSAVTVLTNPSAGPTSLTSLEIVPAFQNWPHTETFDFPYTNSSVSGWVNSWTIPQGYGNGNMGAILSSSAFTDWLNGNLTISIDDSRFYDSPQFYTIRNTPGIHHSELPLDLTLTVGSESCVLTIQASYSSAPTYPASGPSALTSVEQ